MNIEILRKISIFYDYFLLNKKNRIAWDELSHIVNLLSRQFWRPHLAYRVRLVGVRFSRRLLLENMKLSSALVAAIRAQEVTKLPATELKVTEKPLVISRKPKPENREWGQAWFHHLLNLSENLLKSRIN